MNTEIETRLRDDVAACRFVTTAVHYYGSDKDQLANDIEAALDEIGRLRTQLKNTLDASDRLREWKESALAVEREWDAQAVAKMLGLPLGQSIRKGIMRELPRLCARLAEVEHERDEANVALKRYLPLATELSADNARLASEIERWRDATNRLRSEMEHQSARANTAEDDNARLREALEDLVENNTIERVARARAALAQTEAKP